MLDEAGFCKGSIKTTRLITNSPSLCVFTFCNVFTGDFNFDVEMNLIVITIIIVVIIII